MENYIMKKLFIGTPAYEGKVYVQYAMALIDTCELLKSCGIEPIVRIPVSGSLLVADRNRLIQMFWESNADYMLCIDNDLGWNPYAVMRMLNSGKDFVAGVYPTRQGNGFTFRPKLDDENKIEMCTETKLLQMEYIPAGFMLFSRKVIAEMREKYPELYYSPKDARSQTESAFCFFDTEVWEGEFWGEDYVFCRRVRGAGFDIWVDPLIEFNHAGVCGALIQTLTTDKSKAQERHVKILHSST
jgi:hypothetical protein